MGIDLNSGSGSSTGSQGIQGWAYKVQGGQVVGLQGSRGSRGRYTSDSDDLEVINTYICI